MNRTDERLGDGDSAKTNAESTGAYARFEGGCLTIGNAMIERTWQWRDGGLSAMGFLDKITVRQWFSGDPSAMSLMPLSGLALRDILPEFESILTKDGPLEEPSLVVKLTTGTRIHRFKLFDESPGVSMQLIDISTKETPKVSATAAVTTGVELKEHSKADVVVDTLDCFRPAPVHMKLTQVTLIDQTDIHDNLVQENTYLLTVAEKCLQQSGNLFYLEDSLTGDGLISLKIAPLPHARPIRCHHDVLASFGDIRFVGNCAGEDGAGYPMVTLAYNGGRAGRIKALQQYQRLIRPYKSGRDAMFLSNTWGDRNRDGRVNENFMRQEIAAGATLGVDVIQIDDGWQKGRTANSIHAGGVWDSFWASDARFWDFHPERFPAGIRPLVEQARARGMNFGLWFAPDSSNNFANWRRDADAILHLHRDAGVHYFKLDGIKILSRAGESNLHRFLSACIGESDGVITFDLDITAETRPAYFGTLYSGPIFLENRYTDWHRYWPHTTLRNLWQLSHYVDPLRLRMEFLNNTRNPEQYKIDPLSPARYPADYLFASVMFSNPLGWFEILNLPVSFISSVSPLVKTWKSYRDRIFSGTIVPIGQAPDGASWTGFVSVQGDNTGLAVFFRELNQNDTHDFEWPGMPLLTPTITILAGRGRATWEHGKLRVFIPLTQDYLFASIDSRSAVEKLHVE